MKRALIGCTILALIGTFVVAAADAQPSSPGTPSYTQYGEPPVEDNSIFYHALFNEMEGRTNGSETEFRWDGEAWAGTDMNRIWLKSEGFLERGRASDGDTEALYDRPIPYMRFFDLQAGVRYDLDSKRGRAWGALGLEGLVPYWFQFEPTFYFSNDRIAGKIFGAYDLLITNRLILQPQFELNVYSKSDPPRGVGAGLSDIDTGLRLRYEFSRKFAPYIGMAYAGAFGNSATFTRLEGGSPNDPRAVFGVRVWY